MNWDKIEESFREWLENQNPIISSDDIDDDELGDLEDDVLCAFISERKYKNPEKIFDELIN